MSTGPIDAQRPTISQQEVASFSAANFGIVGELQELVSDRDQNFSISTDDAAYVFKIANRDEDPAFLDLQNKALLHLAQTVPSLMLPRLIPTLGGKDMAVLGETASAHLVRVLTYIPGQLFSGTPKNTVLFSSLGTYMGKLSQGLRGFRHVAAHRPDFLWNLDNALACEVWVSDIIDVNNRAIVQACFDRYRQDVLPHIPSLRSAVIHNDINDNNIIVEDNEDTISAVIDFGDMVFASQINELATALAYAFFDQYDILSVSSTIISAYHKEFPLEELEAGLLFDLVAMRLCMSVCISSHREKTDPDNEYLSISQAPAFSLLSKLHGFNRQTLIDHVLSLCGFPISVSQKTSENLDEMIEHRKAVLGPSLSLAYKKHLKVVRGSGAYLYDHTGRAYLDCVNNISHVGHCHPHVVDALSKQAATLNTNTRYLHDTIQQYAERLLATLPDPLSVVYFVCSGSEANELALRLARTKTRYTGTVVLDWAYHGNTSTLIEISPYKFNREGGAGVPNHVRIAEIPDSFRGRYKGRDAETGVAYAKNVEACVADFIKDTGEPPAAFIAESIAGVAGQILYPEEYLQHAYSAARKAGALCIADEVQVGFGRVGTHMWAFEQQGVVPDIVTLGKPIGNGHPMAAVVTTREIADAFANGMEYFNSFGGNPVSCAVGIAVLDVLENEGLQQKALEIGLYLLEGMRKLQDKYVIIGDVRGAGLFLGMELVKDTETLEPASVAADWVVQYCRDEGVLLSTDGPFDNVIKMKPPMVFGRKEADLLLRVLEGAFAELPL